MVVHFYKSLLVLIIFDQHFFQIGENIINKYYLHYNHMPILVAVARPTSSYGTRVLLTNKTIIISMFMLLFTMSSSSFIFNAYATNNIIHPKPYYPYGLAYGQMKCGFGHLHLSDGVCWGEYDRGTSGTGNMTGGGSANSGPAIGGAAPCYGTCNYYGGWATSGPATSGSANSGR
jgi:hypothetical protein